MSKKVIVTGGSGYIGSELVNLLLKSNYKVIIVDKVSPKINHKNLKFVKHDLKYEFDTSLVSGSEYIVHLAAQVGGIAFANLHPAKIFRENLLIDINSIEIARKLKVKKYIYISSSLIYEKSERFPLSEDYSENIILPDLEYGFAKAVGERLCKAYFEEYNLRFNICRLFNVYGINSLGDDDPHAHVIPDIIKKLKVKSKISLLGGGLQTRNFTHVKDVAEALLKILKPDKYKNSVFNIAGDEEIKIKDIAKKVWELTGDQNQLVISTKKNLYKDVTRSFADTTRFKNAFNWKPKIRFNEGLKEMVNKYKV